MTHTLIDQYRPQVSGDTWSTVGPFVRSTVRARFSNGRALGDVQRALSALTGFCDWALNISVGRVDDGVLRADYIDAYRAFRGGEVNAAVAERERKVLYTLAGKRAGVEKRHTTTSASPTEPYTRAEQGAIRRWTEGQSTDSRRRNCLALAALGLGCGLTASEMLHVRQQDVVILEDGMPAVTVPGREVPALAGWSDELASLLTGEPDAWVFAPSRASRQKTNIASIIEAAGQPYPSVQRMRATWLLAHVDGGTPLNNILDASGLTSSDFLRRLLPFAARPTGTTRLAALRLTEGAVR